MKRLAALAFLVAATLPARADFLAREIGSFHIGGGEVALSGMPPKEVSFTAGMAPLKVDPNGEFEAGQMYVQFIRLASPAGRYPILLWHGGGLSGVTWETKPDGQPGWQSWFLQHGYDTYVSDAVERGRASWARYPEIYKSEPIFRPKKEAWELFRIGPTYSPDKAARVAFPDTQFPVSSFDQFVKQGIPRWATNDEATQKAYDALVQKVCPCVIVVHSQGGNFGFHAAMHAPDKVKALVAIEPSGAPDPGREDVSVLKGVPQLIVFGDHLDDSPSWQSFIKAPERYRDAMRAAGGSVEWVSLPAIGIRGNTHMMMMDRNSDEIAGLVSQWLDRVGAGAR